MKSKFSFLVLFFLAFNVWADRVRNGGDYVVCQSNPVQPYFYDLYEMTLIKNQVPKIPKKPFDIFERARVVIQRQSPADIAFTNELLRYLDRMSYEIYWDQPTELEDIDDNPGAIALPGCQIRQAVIAEKIYEEGLPDTWAYFIYEPVYRQMSTDNQVALILHELIYRVASDLGHRTSTAAKLINQQMLMVENPLEKSDSLLKLRTKLQVLMPSEQKQSH